jgi:protein arginine N-methyltransferase 1
LSTRVTLPEPADVIISDLHGVLPLFQGLVPALVDARQRLLAPDGAVIPQRETLWAALAEAPNVYSEFTKGCELNTCGLDLGAALQHTTNTWRKARLRPDQLLAEPRCWATLDFTTPEQTNLGATLHWTVARPGIGHGLAVWFDTTLAEGVSFSNAPGEPELIYGNAVFPWSRPVPLLAGDRVDVALKADLVGGDYVWRWDSRVLDRLNPGQVKASFQQSSFYAVPLVPARLRKLAASHVPLLNEDGQIDRLILEMMDGMVSLGDIARQVCDRFSTRFTSLQDALTRVGELSGRYSR